MINSVNARIHWCKDVSATIQECSGGSLVASPVKRRTKRRGTNQTFKITGSITSVLNIKMPILLQFQGIVAKKSGGEDREGGKLDHEPRHENPRVDRQAADPGRSAEGKGVFQT